jgi:tripartite motif-containing protein 71
MERRDFIKSVGVFGALSLLGVIPLYGSGGKAPESAPVLGSGCRRHLGLDGPFDLALESSGNLLVTDPPGYRVVRIDSKRQPISSFGTPGSRVGSLNFPKGIAVDESGHIYVVDSNNCRVQVFDQDGTVRKVIGSVGSIGGSFSTPQGVCVDPSGRLLIADTRNHRIQIYQNGSLTAILGELGDANDQFRLPTACAVRSNGEILVLDSKHGMVKVFGPDLAFRASFGGAGARPGRMNMPQGLELDASGCIWVADTGNHRIQQFDADGKLICVLGKKGPGDGEFQSPTAVRCREDTVYVVDNGNRRIQILSRDRAQVGRCASSADTSEEVLKSTSL